MPGQSLKLGSTWFAAVRAARRVIKATGVPAAARFPTEKIRRGPDRKRIEE
jgi:hypothetical protein